MSKSDRPARRKRETDVVEAYCPLCESSFPAALTKCPTDGTRLVRLSQKEVNLVGTRFDGRFEILGLLGDGGMGAVYLANEPSKDRQVAIKLIRSELTNDIAVAKRFLREARVSSRVVHANTVKVFEYGQSAEGILFLAMELLEGPTLDEVLAQDRRVAPGKVGKIGWQIFDALSCAHEQGVVHRDLKPSNVMLVVDSSGHETVKLLDFGLAKSLGSESHSSKGFLMGTPAYLAPEVILRGEVGFASDLYAAGVLLYEILSGRVPFEDEEIPAVLMAHAHRPPPPMPFDVPTKVSKFVLRLLSKEPNDRYGSAKECQRSLAAALIDLSDTEKIRLANAETLEFEALTPTGAWTDEDDTGTIRSPMSFAPSEWGTTPTNRTLPEPGAHGKGRKRKLAQTKTKLLTTVPPLREMDKEILDAVAYDENISKKMEALLYDPDNDDADTHRRSLDTKDTDRLVRDDASTNRMPRQKSAPDTDEITARRIRGARSRSEHASARDEFDRAPNIPTDIVGARPLSTRRGRRGKAALIWIAVATVGVVAGAITWWLLGA